MAGVKFERSLFFQRQGDAHHKEWSVIFSDKQNNEQGKNQSNKQVHIRTHKTYLSLSGRGTI